MLCRYVDEGDRIIDLVSVIAEIKGPVSSAAGALDLCTETQKALPPSYYSQLSRNTYPALPKFVL
jgi:hypothetical protein